MKNIIRIKGENINLCILRTDEEAIEKYLQWMNSNEEILPWIKKHNSITQRISEEKWALSEIDDSIKRFNIVTKDNILIGNCELRISKNHISGTLGITIGEKDECNKGYGTEAIKMLIDFGFNQCNLHRIELTLNANNKRALNCYKKCGLKVVGRLHEDDYYDGHYCDTLIMEILKKNYQNKIINN